MTDLINLEYNRRGNDFQTPTPGQVSALTKFSQDSRVPEPFRVAIAAYLKANRMEFTMASQIIGMLKDWVEQAPSRKVSQSGIYVNRQTDTYYMVQRSQAGRLYAKVLVRVTSGKRNDDGTWDVYPIWNWEYAAGMINKINADWRITAEEAKAFGDYFHHCIRCHIRLTKQESIERGTGDVCAGKL